jgi:hypothetical protein
MLVRVRVGQFHLHRHQAAHAENRQHRK